MKVFIEGCFILELKSLFLVKISVIYNNVLLLNLIRGGNW